MNEKPNLCEVETRASPGVLELGWSDLLFQCTEPGSYLFQATPRQNNSEEVKSHRVSECC